MTILTFAFNANKGHYLQLVRLPFLVVPGAGLEPARPFGQRILSP